VILGTVGLLGRTNHFSSWVGIEFTHLAKSRDNPTPELNKKTTF